MLRVGRQRTRGPRAGPSRIRSAPAPEAWTSELEDESPPDASGLDGAVGFRRLVGREHPGDPQRDLARLGLLAEAIQLGLLAGVVADHHRVERDAPHLGLRAPVTPDRGDAAAVADSRDGVLVQQGRVDQAVGTGWEDLAEAGAEVVAAGQDRVGAELGDQLLVLGSGV